MVMLFGFYRIYLACSLKPKNLRKCLILHSRDGGLPWLFTTGFIITVNPQKRGLMVKLSEYLYEQPCLFKLYNIDE